MRDFSKKAAKHRFGKSATRVLEFTPYTQRPIELWIRHQVLPLLPESHRFEVDEALGGNKAPLTARMHYLKSHLRELQPTEVWPKLSVAVLCAEMGIERRIVSAYRHMEEGVHAREEILEALTEHHGIFVYERDLRKLAQSLTSFDAFICAYTALLVDNDRCEPIPKGFPASSGWVFYPSLEGGA
jgi:hypothetical protein